MGNAAEINSSNKIFSHLDTLSEMKKGHNPAPITVSFTLTDICNNRCPRCMEVSGRQPSMPRMKDPERIIKQIAEIGAKAMVFSGGGEPLVYPTAVDVIEYAHSLGLECGLVTNGLALTPDKADRLVKVCTWIKISLDASTPEEYMATHGMPAKAFEIVMDNIRYIGPRKRSCMVGVAYLTGKVNKNGMVDATRAMLQAGVSYINFRPFQGDKDRFDKELAECKTLETDDFKVVFKAHKYDDWWKIKMQKCWFQRLYPLIAADGCLYPCCDTRGKQKYNMGSLYEHTLQELWDKQEDLVTPDNFSQCNPNCIGLKVNAMIDEIYAPKTHSSFL